MCNRDLLHFGGQWECLHKAVDSASDVESEVAVSWLDYQSGDWEIKIQEKTRTQEDKLDP